MTDRAACIDPSSWWTRRAVPGSTGVATALFVAVAITEPVLELGLWGNMPPVLNTLCH